MDVTAIFGLSLPPDRKYELELSCGEFSKSLAGLTVKDGMITLNQRLQLVYETSYPAGGLSLPDVFVYLKQDKTAPFFVRLKADTVINQTDSSYSIHPFQIDRSSNDTLKDHESGYIRLRCQARDESGKTQPLHAPNPTPKLSRLFIVCNIIRGIEMPSADDNGLSDPIVTLAYASSRVKTTIARNTLDPIWNQRLVIDAVAYDDVLLPIVMQVFDVDNIDSRPELEFLGRCLINLPSQVSELAELNIVKKPQWYDIEHSKKLKMGKILASF